MILNSQTATLIRDNAARLADAVNTKEDLTDLITAANYLQVCSALEALLINTNMFFDEELLTSLEENNWMDFKALLLMYTLNSVNRNFSKSVSKTFASNTHTNQSEPQIL